MTSASSSSPPSSNDEGHIRGYKTLVELTTKRMPTFAPLKNFLNKSGHETKASKLDLIEFDQNGQPSYNLDLKFKDLQSRLSLGLNEDKHQLLLIENVTRDVITFLGENWQIPPDFFLAHLENSNWYSLQNIPQNLPSLQSVQQDFVRFQFIGPREFIIDPSITTANQGSIRCDLELPDRFSGNTDPEVEGSATIGRIAGGFNPISPPREDSEDFPPEDLNHLAMHDTDDLRPEVLNHTAPQDVNNPPNIQPQDSNHLPTQDANHPHAQDANRPASQAPACPAPPPHDREVHGPIAGMRAKPVGFVRNSVTIWFNNLHHHGENSSEAKDRVQGSSSNQEKGSNWKRGVILFDAPFKAKNICFANRNNSIYRSFMHRRDPPYISNDDFDDRKSYKDSFIKCLRHNEDIKKTKSTPRPFMILQDLCRIIASEWIVFNTYMERELNNIDRWFELEGEDCDKKLLHKMLSQLMMARRRLLKYDMLVANQLELCPLKWRHAARGGSSSMMAMAAYHTEPPPGLLDFFQVQEHFAHNKVRIAQAIKVITAFMTIHQSMELVQQTRLSKEQNRLSEARNAKLTLLIGATGVFFPFTTVAVIMTIPNNQGGPDLGPGGKNFWKFWASSAPITVLLLLLVYLSWKISPSTERNGSRRQTTNRNIPVEGDMNGQVSNPRPIDGLSRGNNGRTEDWVTNNQRPIRNFDECSTQVGRSFDLSRKSSRHGSENGKRSSGERRVVSAAEERNGRKGGLLDVEKGLFTVTRRAEGSGRGFLDPASLVTA